MEFEKVILNASDPNQTQCPLNKDEQRIYNNMKRSLEQIQLHQEGEIQLKDARELLNEL